MKKKWIFFCAIALCGAIAAAGCGVKDDELVFQYSFDQGAEGWEGGYSDLPVDYEEDFYELIFEHALWPESLGSGKKALLISGHNRSDDLFMFITKQLGAADGLKPNTTYLVEFVIEFATDAPAGAVGIGGAPGESVYVKVGAVNTKPEALPTGEVGGSAYYEINIDKGNQSSGGRDAVIIGDVAKDDGIADDFTYGLKTLESRNHVLEVTNDEEGNLWLIIGTDSGFEGKTALYYTNIAVTLTEKA